MSDPITIWVVDDDIRDSKRAIAAVGAAVRAARREGDPPEAVLWAGGFEWFPAFRESVDLKAPTISSSAYPEIVVLDLMKGTPKGEVMQGDQFYYALRKWELSNPEKKRALVLVWSWHLASKDTETFVRDHEQKDSRLIPLATKQPSLLQTKLVSLWARVIEERGNR